MESHSIEKTAKETNERKKLIINNRFEVREFRQETTFSKIYNGLDLDTKNEVLMKFVRAEKVKSQFQTNYSLLSESDVVPKLLGNEVINELHVFTYELKGLDLNTLFNNAQWKFSSITIAMIFHLTILALEKLHSKEIVHTNIKPSKVLISKEKGDDRLFLIGLEFSEKMTKPKLNRSRSGTPRKKRMNENVFSSLNVHSGESIGYRDDLESLSYMIINFFTQGKFFRKLSGASTLTKKSRESLVSLKTNILSEILLSGIPLEIFDFIKYVSKLKVNEMPNYEYLKGLSLKLCQKFYVRNDLISCLDWVYVPPEESNLYRSKMLSYFFCGSVPQMKKNKSMRVDEVSNATKKKSSSVKRTSTTNTNVSEYLMKNFQGVPIYEITNDSADSSRIMNQFMLSAQNEEYQSIPPTARLSLFKTVFIPENDSNLRFVSHSDFVEGPSCLDDSISKSPSSMDSLDDGRSSDDERPVDPNRMLDGQSNVKPSNFLVQDFEFDLNRSVSNSSTKSKTSTNRLPPSILRPEPMKYKLMPK